MIRKISLVLIHAAFLLIIAGAIVSGYLRVTGTVTVGKGETADVFVGPDSLTHPLPSPLRLDSIAVIRYAGTAKDKDYVSYITLLRPVSFQEWSDTISGPVGESFLLSVNSPVTEGGCRIYHISFEESGRAVFGATCDRAGTMLCFAGFLLFSLGAVMIMLTSGKTERLMLVVLLAVVALLTFFMEREVLFQGLTPLLRSAWLPLHVSLMAVSYTVFIMLTVASAGFLLFSRRCAAWAGYGSRLLLPGVLFLGLGICAGSVWAAASWGSYWNWDPKETWALVTFVVYSVPLHRHIRFLRDSRNRSVYLLLCSLFVVMTWFGVRFLDSLHSY